MTRPRITYNAPVVLSFALLATLVLVAGAFTQGAITARWFAVYPPLEIGRPQTWLRLGTHVLGHQDAGHLVGNLTFLLLLGPAMEEKYGSLALLEMIGLTAVATGLCVCLLFSSGLMGASGIVFMLIILSSFTNVRKGEIPLTFLLVGVLFIGKELVAAFQHDEISQLAHILGGLCGGVFGLIQERKTEPTADPITSR